MNYLVIIFQRAVYSIYLKNYMNFFLLLLLLFFGWGGGGGGQKPLFDKCEIAPLRTYQKYIPEIFSLCIVYMSIISVFRLRVTLFLL